MTKGRYRIVLADDHAMFRHGLKSVLARKGDLDVVGEAADGLELLKLLTSAKLAPHMAIIDISMPNLGGLEATSRIKNTYPDTKVVILSMHEEKEYVHRALSVGADGYLLTQDSSAELFSAIEKSGRVECIFLRSCLRWVVFDYMLLTISKWLFVCIDAAPVFRFY